MRKSYLYLVLIAVFLLGGCAGMPQQYQRNMEANAGLWGIFGAITGAGIAAATHGNIGRSAIIGGLAGSYMGAANTPRHYYRRYYRPNYRQNRNSWDDDYFNSGEYSSYLRGRADREREMQEERERRAYLHGRYGW